VFCGDFNNVPQSLLYRFVRGYMFNYSDQEARNFNGSRPWAIKNGVLKSAYSYYQRNNSERTSRSFTLNKEIEGEPPFTTVTSRRCHTVDYIWYSFKHIRLKQLLSFPSEESLREEKLTGAPCGGLPNSCQPSDHLSLMACFEFLVPRNKNNAR
jgi:mRNA deadenylase 3'-5' endonuclease subunit Ccr4